MSPGGRWVCQEFCVLAGRAQGPAGDDLPGQGQAGVDPQGGPGGGEGGVTCLGGPRSGGQPAEHDQWGGLQGEAGGPGQSAIQVGFCHLQGHSKGTN